MAFLLVIPSIDIKDGKLVRVVQGIPELNVPEYINDPVEMAEIWRAENAKMIHVVDFNGFSEHSDRNHTVVGDICDSVIIPVQYAGGIRSLEEAKRVFDYGVSRICVSTITFENIPEFQRILEQFGPSKVVVSIDVLDNRVMIRAKKQKTESTPLEHATKLRAMGVERFLITDVSRNGMLGGPDLELSKQFCANLKCKVTVSGGVRNKDELMDIQNYLPLGIDSVIVGRALYENRFPCQRLWRVAESGLFT
ncbi:MAG: 1-(5-phosphoribosyl)-5-[(5-phosphoribosylamino)methylideneamino] imidazole-4-carboxamide isomerase [Ignavibacteria bacterium]|nr:1-(5-phosphoribosyl)-5-[(5-phosphoribosylamino)methylideneamino] imidazole-4-carboxamide isomerase [Ignavibacteria bacterium]